jgi:DNA-binding CsgD family transcriptional regulator
MSTRRKPAGLRLSENPLWRRTLGGQGRAGRLRWAHQIEQLCDGFADVLEDFGVTAFSYRIVRCPSLLADRSLASCAVSTFQGMGRLGSAAEEWSRDSSVLNRVLQDSSPFAWTEVPSASLTTAGEPQDPALARIMMFPVHAPHGVGALTVLAREDLAEVRGNTITISALAHLFHHRIHRPLAEQAMVVSRRRSSVLSPRETQMLQLAAVGKSTSEISKATGISAKSVEFHIERARNKLNAGNRTHAVVQAMTLGLLTFDDS